MKVLAISDLHGFLPSLNPEIHVDVLLVGGDLVPDSFSDRDNPPTESQKGYWLRNDFSDWCALAPADKVIVIAGNHDVNVMRNPGMMQDVSCIYLQDETIEIDGIKIHGTPWTPRFGNWAFMMSDSDLNDRWDMIPEDVDIILSHGPAYGILDVTPPWWGSESVGSQTLRNKIDYGAFPNLKLFLSGHIHHSYGKMEHNGIQFANISYVNEGYEPVNKPMFFEV